MRLRHIQGAEEAIASSPFVIQEPESHRGCWNQVFGNENPIEIEVGMGKGRFIMEKAAANPHILFAPGEVSRIYLNFSDPWPKDRHAKRRLTSPAFLNVYDQILAPLGTVEFKTDNRGLFDYSLESIPASGWEIAEHTFDLHHSPMAEGNVMTEYEMKFSSEGKPICKLIARRS